MDIKTSEIYKAASTFLLSGWYKPDNFKDLIMMKKTADAATRTFDVHVHTEWHDGTHWMPIPEKPEETKGKNYEL